MKRILFTLLAIATISLQAQNETVVGRVVNGQYVDVIQGGTIPSVNYLAPLDSLMTAAVDSLYLDYAFYQTGVNQDRRKLLRKNNGRLDLFPPSTTLPLNTVWRFRTGATNDTIAINPFNSYNLVFDGQTTGNAAYISGLYEGMYAEKVATDTILLAGANLVEYTYTPPSSCTPDANEWYTEASAISDPNCNEADSNGSWITSGGTITRTTDNTTGTWAFTNSAPAATVTYMYYTFSATIGDTFTVTWDAKESGIGADAKVAIWENVDETVNQVFTTSWASYT
ncbi:MAG: hypothetical protein KJO86_03455, partial [Muriicola sp.]|nr:hypothetical protein [Muriicola sp.]